MTQKIKFKAWILEWEVYNGFTNINVIEYAFLLDRCIVRRVEFCNSNYYYLLCN